MSTRAGINRKHGHCSRLSGATRTYRIWQGMVTRCTNQNSPHYLKYGARGIRICDRWLSFEAFLLDMGEAPDGLSIDRVNNDAGYEPSNCRWASLGQQASNTRRNVYVEFQGHRLTLAEWSRRTGLARKTIWHRIYRFGWTAEEALSASPDPRSRKFRRSVMEAA